MSQSKSGPKRSLSFDEYLAGVLVLGIPKSTGQIGEARCLPGITDPKLLERTLLITPSWDPKIVTHQVRSRSVSTAHGEVLGWENSKPVGIAHNGVEGYLEAHSIVAFRKKPNGEMFVEIEGTIHDGTHGK